MQTMIIKISTVDAAANYLKQKIALGELKPGEALPSERNLQKDLSISRFTLREALAKLQALGLIEVSHGKGAFVTQKMRDDVLGDVFLPLFADHTLERVIEFVEARVLIECESAALCAARRTNEDLARLRGILETSRRHFDDPVRYGELDYEFHTEISKAARNVFLQQMVGCLNDYVKRYLRSISSDEESRRMSFASHEQILARIADGNPEEACAVTRQHLGRMLTLLKKLREKNQAEISLRELGEIIRLSATTSETK